MTDLEQRRALLTAALGFVRLEVDHPGVDALKSWLSDWRGIGVITTGMARQGWDLQLTAYAGAHWRATFFVAGQAHSVFGGSA